MVAKLLAVAPKARFSDGLRRKRKELGRLGRGVAELEFLWIVEARLVPERRLCERRDDPALDPAIEPV